MKKKMNVVDFNVLCEAQDLKDKLQEKLVRAIICGMRALTDDDAVGLEIDLERDGFDPDKTLVQIESLRYDKLKDREWKDAKEIYLGRFCENHCVEFKGLSNDGEYTSIAQLVIDDLAAVAQEISNHVFLHEMGETA